MIQSPQVLEWQAQTRATTLLELLRLKFSSIPDELANRIGATRDIPTMQRWMRLVVQASSVEQFRQEAGL